MNLGALQPDSRRIAVIGLGNILFSDEGAGVYASRYLKANYDFSPNIDLIDGGTLGMNLVDYMASYDHLVLLDTLSVDAPDAPGTVYCLDSEVLQGLGRYRATAHEVEVLQTLELGALMGERADVQVVAVVPEEIETVAISLTASVTQAIPLLIETVLGQLHDLGVASRPRQQTVPLEEVVAGYRQGKHVSCA